MGSLVLMSMKFFKSFGKIDQNWEQDIQEGEMKNFWIKRGGEEWAGKNVNYENATWFKKLQEQTMDSLSVDKQEMKTTVWQIKQIPEI